MIPSYSDMKLAEMLLPSASPAPARGTLGAAASAPVFKDINGQVITSIKCGGQYTFEVPGYSQVWLTMYKNSKVVFDGQFAVPMPLYTSTCSNDVGAYQAVVYDLNTGIVIGTTNFSVLASDGSVTPSGSFLADVPTPVLIGGAVLAIYMLSKKGRK